MVETIVTLILLPVRRVVDGRVRVAFHRELLRVLKRKSVPAIGSPAACKKIILATNVHYSISLACLKAKDK